MNPPVDDGCCVRVEVPARSSKSYQEFGGWEKGPNVSVPEREWDPSIDVPSMESMDVFPSGVMSSGVILLLAGLLSDAVKGCG